MGLIRVRGDFPNGGYDVYDGVLLAAVLGVLPGLVRQERMHRGKGRRIRCRDAHGAATRSLDELVADRALQPLHLRDAPGDLSVRLKRLREISASERLRDLFEVRSDLVARRPVIRVDRVHLDRPARG